MGRLILASGSPRRRLILTALGVAFDVQTADVEEAEPPTGDPWQVAIDNAVLKARAVAALQPDRPILASDTVVALGSDIFYKPRDREDACQMLARLQGQTHVVATGLALIRGDDILTDCSLSDVTFRALDRAAIEAYVDRVPVLDKAGAYGIQEERDRILARWTGSFSGIMGLPVTETIALLQHFGIPVPAPGPDGPWVSEL